MKFIMHLTKSHEAHCHKTMHSQALNQFLELCDTGKPSSKLQHYPSLFQLFRHLTVPLPPPFNFFSLLLLSLLPPHNFLTFPFKYGPHTSSNTIIRWCAKIIMYINSLFLDLMSNMYSWWYYDNMMMIMWWQSQCSTLYTSMPPFFLSVKKLKFVK